MNNAKLFKTIAIMLVICIVPCVAMDAAQGNAAKEKAAAFKEGELLIKFRADISPSRVAQIRIQVGLRAIKRFPRFGLHHLKLTVPGLSVPKAVKLLNRLPEVEFAEPNYFLYADTTPNDEFFHHLWGLENTGQTGGTAGSDINATEAWEITTGDPSVVVAVIDSGVDYTHADLAYNMWVNPNEIPRNELDDDGNGYVDDIYGIDAVNNDSDPMDDDGHGTHVAGTIGALGNNSYGVAGVNWDASIMALKFLNASGVGLTSDAIECLNYVGDMKLNHGVNVKLTNNSWGGGAFDNALRTAIENLGSIGVLFVASAGNDTSDNEQVPHYPSSYRLDNVLSVAATDHNDSLATFSNYGLLDVPLAAPGMDILSAFPDNTFDLFSGTSMAAPHVSGVAALLWADNPTLSHLNVKETILGSVDPIPSLRGKVLTGGRLNAFDALTCDPSVVNLETTLADGFVVDQGVPKAMAAQLSACGFLRNATVSAQFSNGDPDVTLADDGFAPDRVAGDGIYIGSWTPITLGQTTVTISAIQTIYNLQASVTGTVTTGYTFDDLVPFDWIDIRETGAPLSLPDDGYAHFPVPFSVSFYGMTYDSISVSSDGRIYFDDLAPHSINACIPSELASGIDSHIAALWDDLNPAAGGEVYWEVRGISPYRMLIIQYDGVPHAPATGAVTFEVLLFEGSDDVLFQYLDVDFGNAAHDFGATATVGVQRDPFFGQEYSCSEAVLADNMAILWYFEDNFGPGIGLDTATLDNSAAKGDNAPDQSFEVWNFRVGTLSYSITDDADWLYLIPPSGASTGERDTITVHYMTSGLSEGIHRASIKVSDPNAINNPQYIDVSVTVNPDTLALTVNVSPASAGTVSGAGDYFLGETAVVEAFPNAGWIFDHWEGGSIHGSTQNPAQITMTADQNVTAVFSVPHLSQILLTYPANDAIQILAPSLAWSPNAGTSNVFIVDLALSLSGPVYSSPITRNSSWTIPFETWSKVPSGANVYWRVRGADRDHVPLNIITSDEVGVFRKY